MAPVSCKSYDIVHVHDNMPRPGGIVLGWDAVLAMFIVGTLCQSSIIKCGGVAFEKPTSLSLPRHASKRDIVYAYMCGICKISA